VKLKFEGSFVSILTKAASDNSSMSLYVTIGATLSLELVTKLNAVPLAHFGVNRHIGSAQSIKPFSSSSSPF